MLARLPVAQVLIWGVALSVSLSMLAACSGGGGEAAPARPTNIGSGSVPPVPPPPFKPQSATDVQYGTGLTSTGSKRLLLDIYQSGEVCRYARPVVVLIHGGAFRTGAKNDSEWPGIAQDLTDRGYVAVSIDYRLQGDDPIPSAEFEPLEQALAAAQTEPVSNEQRAQIRRIASAIEDAATALRWIEANADAHCVDASRIGLWGGSAGAIIALHTAYALDDLFINVPRPLAVIDYWGALYLDDVIDAQEAPFFIIHGSEDRTVSYQRALELEAQAARVGLNFSFYTIHQARHGFSWIRIRDVTLGGEPILTVTLEFLDAHLKTGTPNYETRIVPRPGD